MDQRVIYPFDTELNEAVLVMAGRYVPVYVIADNAPSTYRQLKEHLDAGKTMVVAHEGSNNTIFADPHINFAFRAWHDWCHWKGEYDFSLYGESATYCMQLDQLLAVYGNNWRTRQWSDYLKAEVIGQRQYYEKYKAYIDDQRSFVAAYVANPVTALDKRW
jgi:hypothetical protein